MLASQRRHRREADADAKVSVLCKASVKWIRHNHFDSVWACLRRRPEVTGTDLVFVQIACLGIAGVVRDAPPFDGRDDVPELYRHYLHMILQGLRPSPDTAPYPVPALTTAELHKLLRSGVDGD